MPFGLSNSPATLQCLMTQVFQYALGKFVLVFLTTFWFIVAAAGTFLVMTTFWLEVEYFGHSVSGHGVVMDNSKTKAVMEWPNPFNVKQLWGFLGLTGYY